jgi:diguanylate cyclase (GGDEF)-like protein/PAS domain S-box-containing protein
MRPQVIIGVIASLGTSALAVFLSYWNSRLAGLRASASSSMQISPPLIAGFAALALVLSAITAWLMWRELRRAAKQPPPIAEDEYQYRELCDSASDLIDIVSPDGKLLYTNVAWRKTLGYSVEEAAKLRLQDVVHPDDWLFAQKNIHGLLAGEPRNNVFGVRLRTKSGEILRLEGTVSCSQEKGKPVVMAILRDVTAQKVAEQELHELQGQLREALAKEQELARVDPLTHVSNRRAFYEQAEVEIARARRYSRPLCIAYMDIDDFKLVNDKLGHSTGDAVLVTLASALRAKLRISDVVARMGGDEFAVLLPETDAASAELVLKKVQKSLLETVAQNRWNITFSIGAASFPTPPASLEAMIRVADEAMYAVKAHGKNDVSIVVGE